MKKQYAIELDNLSFYYHKNQSVLEKLSVGFSPERFTVLLGVNGCGKSTLFRIIAGLQKGYEGEIRFFGRENATLSSAEKAETIGFLPQAFQSVFPFSVREILQTGRAAFSRFSLSKNDDELIEQIAHQLDLSDLLSINFNELSGGQQQRVLIGRILVQNPKIILLDEPTNHLDIHQQHELMAYLRHLTRQGYTVLAIMHDPSLAIRYADSVFLLHQKTMTPFPETTTERELILEQVFSLHFSTLDFQNEKILIPKLRS